MIGGKIQNCVSLDESKVKAIPRATIKTTEGKYVSTIFYDCNVGDEVKVIIKRGALFFNTTYEAEKANP